MLWGGKKTGIVVPPQKPATSVELCVVTHPTSKTSHVCSLMSISWGAHASSAAEPRVSNSSPQEVIFSICRTRRSATFSNV